MNVRTCEREEQTSAAILNGTITPDIASHVTHCRTCSDILLVSGFLHEEGTVAEGMALPDADVIWRKAQWRATERAVRVATRPIRWMTAVACVVFVCSPWLRPVLPLVQELTSLWSRTLDFSLGPLSKIWLALPPSDPVILLALSGTMALLGLSSWLMLRDQ